MGARRWVWLLGVVSAVSAAPADEAVVRLFQPVHCTPSAVLRKLGLAPDGSRVIEPSTRVAQDLEGIRSLRADDARGVVIGTGTAAALDGLGRTLRGWLDVPAQPLHCTVYYGRFVWDKLHDPLTHASVDLGWPEFGLTPPRTPADTFVMSAWHPHEPMLRMLQNATGQVPMPLWDRVVTSGEPVVIPLSNVAAVGPTQVERTTRLVLWPRLISLERRLAGDEISLRPLPTVAWWPDARMTTGTVPTPPSLSHRFHIGLGDPFAVAVHAPKQVRTPLDGWPLFVADDKLIELVVVEIQLPTPPQPMAPDSRT